MTMTPDEVVKVLESLERLAKTNREFSLNVYINKEMQQALSSAISLIQDYQKLREKLTVEKIEEHTTKHLQEGIDHYFACHTEPSVCACATIHCINMECGSARRFLSQSIVTYLGGKE